MAVTLDSLRKAVKKNKGRSQAKAWLADMERASGDYDAALKIVDEALASSPSDVPAMLVRAKILAGQQDFAGSISQYKKVLAKDPFCLSAHKRMGESYDKLGKIAERNACFRRVHDMDPLDTFWKDEYDVPTEEEQASLVPPPMDDNAFTMDVDNDAENADVGEDNIFANLAASLPNTDDEDNSAMDALRNSLNTVSDELSGNGDGSDVPDFGDHVFNSSEVSSAISGILGGDDDLDVLDSTEKEEPETSSLFSHFTDDEKIDSLEEPKSDENTDKLFEETPSLDSEEKSEESVFSLDSLDDSDLDKPLETESKTTNVDDAFSSLLGDDELPDEKSAEESVVENADLTLEEPAEKVESEPAETNVDDAFSSLLGDDELPEEKPVDVSTDSSNAVEENDSDSFGSLFEKSADADFSLNENAPAEEPALEEPALENAEVEKQEEPAEEESFGSLFEKSADVDFSMSDDAPASDATDAPAETAVEKAPEFVPSESAENVAPAEGLVPTSHIDFSDEEDLSKPNDNVVFNSDENSASNEDVDGAFDALFGGDDVVEEKPVPENIAEETPATETPKEDLAKEMGGAFASMFGDDDFALPEEKSEATTDVESPAEEPLSEEATSAKIEENAVKEDVEKSVDESFNSIFGSGDDLPDEEPEKPAETLEAPSADLDSIDSEVSNAFKGLFDEDDSLTEADEPNNKGVDYLMSGDSDDEVSASLVENADAPLSRGAADLDDSLNTRTLADIYMEQGVYSKALEIYSDLAKKNPNNAEIKSRLEEVEKLCREKFGEN